LTSSASSTRSKRSLHKWVAVALVALFVVLWGGATNARADSVSVAYLGPSSGAHIAYTDWMNASRYVTFTIKADDHYPCGGNWYYLEVNGKRVGEFGSDCKASVFIPGPGGYSWRVTLVSAQMATAAFQASAFTVDPQVVTPPPHATPTPTPPADTKRPAVTAISSYAKASTTARLAFTLRDDSQLAKLTVTVRTPTRVLGRIHTGLRLAVGDVGYVRWRVPKTATPGTKTFCVLAEDQAYHVSQPSCATLTIG
jgi:hypothetical protein